MKQIYFDRKFRKQLKNLISNANLENSIKARIDLFLQNPYHPLLRNHQLKGKQQNFRAFSITGDLRIIYVEIEDKYYFLEIGAHNQVYQ